jgi:hypothetical protein
MLFNMNNINRQEVLLMTGSSFAARQFATGDETNKKSATDELKEACWSGLMRDLLPEIFSAFPDKSGLFLWEIHEGLSFLELDLGTSPAGKELEYSIDPYLCMQTLNMN